MARNECPRQPLAAVISAASIYHALSHTSSIPMARRSGTFCAPLFNHPALRQCPSLHSPPLHSTPLHHHHRSGASEEAKAAATMGVQKRALLASLLLAALATQAFVSVSARSGPTDKASQDDVKKPDCVPSLDPRSFPGHGGTVVPLPSHGGSSGSTPPYHGGSPSHSGSGSIPDPSHGGYGTPPSHGSSGGSIPDPSHAGGGYGSTTPAAPWHTSPTPSTGSSPTPAYGGSPTTPSGHGSAMPTPLVPVDPNSAGTCDYWRTHPMQIWSALGSWPSSMSHFFGSAGGAAAAGGSNVSIQDALANTRTDGAGALLREGAAALLNSMTRAGYPYTTDQVRSAFVAAAAGGSDNAAAAQAAAFKKANEGSKA
ncbi:unnamed protein product [Alopecurus aequalis]